MKISIIGAGNVGAAVAERVLTHNLADVVLVDVVEGLAKGKALDLSDASKPAGYTKGIIGTESYEEVRDSEAVVITAGFPRKPGMSRDDLAEKNGEIVKSAARGVKRFSPGGILIVVTNPLDIMTYLAYKESGCDRSKIMGMASNLDSARFAMSISQKLNVPVAKIETHVLGSHGDTMVPLVSKTIIDGKPLKELLGQKEIEELLEKTKKRGGEIVGLLKRGSAYFSPSAAVFEILKAIVHDEKKAIPCSCILNGEYGLSDVALGVPAKIGRDGIQEILEWDLSQAELSALKSSAKAGRNSCKKQIG